MHNLSNTMVWCYPSSHQNIEKIVKAVKRFINHFPIGEKDRFALELLLREALTNAVTHGSVNDPNKSMTCWIRIFPEKVMIKVQDDGAGFNWKETNHPEPEQVFEHGRGLMIFEKYASCYEFNLYGNAVILWRDLLKGENGNG